ncbi:MAG: hypothetical protein R3249_06050 [Nitriliruptorales bacterium]|nr:hypothetical protein [Nitriliruptorales bacterium]
MRKLSKYPLYIAVGFAAVGFLLIFVAWSAAAELDHTSGQIPILISGGLTGLGLVAVGLTMAITAELRRTTGQLMGELSEVREALAASAATGPAATRSARPGEVVAGASTYHRSTCHLVEGRDDPEHLDAADARDRGLEPCRICKPDETTG